MLRIPSSGNLRSLASCLALLLTAGCEVGGGFSVLPGPAVPSPTPTSPPYVWDTREELDICVNNPVTRVPYPLTIVGEGRDAFVRMELRATLFEGVLRGPDLTSPARGVRGLRIWYRWRPDPKLVCCKTLELRASFDAVEPRFPPQQPTGTAVLQPADERTLAEFLPGSFNAPLDVKYVYFDQFRSNAGVFEIDRIELVQ